MVHTLLFLLCFLLPDAAMPRKATAKQATPAKKLGGTKRKADSTATGATKRQQTSSARPEIDESKAGMVMSFGSGDMSQLGLGESETMRERKFPTVLKALKDCPPCVGVAAGALHNAAVLTDGTVWTWGCDDDKALGREGNEWTPAKVGGALTGEHVVQVACGSSHTVALTAEGRVYSWGTFRDAQGVMGYDKKTDKCDSPRLVDKLSDKKVVQIAAGDHHDLALTANGEVYNWGDIGLGCRSSSRLKTTRLDPRRVGFSKVGRKDVHVSKVFAGGANSFAVTQEGKVLAWGPNNYGMCGQPKDNTFVKVPTLVPCDAPVEQIAAAVHHTVLLTRDGKVLSMGRGAYGRLGSGNQEDRDAPGEVQLELEPDERVVQVGCGEAHTLLVTSAGRLFTMGNGDLLQLGNGKEEDNLLPCLVQSQQLSLGDRKVVMADGGSQHSVIVVHQEGELPVAEQADKGAADTEASAPVAAYVEDQASAQLSAAAPDAAPEDIAPKDTAAESEDTAPEGTAPEDTA
eukprot:g47531.t1